MLADIVGKRKVEERLAKVEAERDAERERAAQEATARAEAEAEIERLRRIIESNGSN